MPSTLTLPRPDSELYPTAPVGWTTNPGGGGFPSWRTGADAGAPVIGFQTDMTFPGETIAIMGDRLAGAGFVLWSEGAVFRTPALRTANDRAQIVVPTQNVSATNSVTQPMTRSMLLLWAHNASGFSLPVRINAPEIFWIYPGRKWRILSDRTIRIFGKNLCVPGITPTVVVRRDNGALVQLAIVSRTENEIVATMPARYAAGVFTVQVHNGTGGIYGWSNIDSFTAATKTYNTSTVFAVDSQAGSTPQAKLTAAINAARLNGGGTVLLGAGTYPITSRIDVPQEQWEQPPILIKGTGRDVTILQASSEQNLWLYGAGSGIEDVSLINIRVNVRNQDCTIQRCVIDVYDHPIEVYTDYMLGGGAKPRQNVNVIVTDNILRAHNACLKLGAMSYGLVSRNTFLTRFQNGYGPGPSPGNNLDNQGISCRSVHKVIIEDNTFRSQDPLAGQIMTRAIAFLHSADSCCVIQRNRAEWIGAFPASTVRDTNSGEVILFHGEDVGLVQTVHSSSDMACVVNRPVGEFTSSVLGTYETDMIGQQLLHAVVLTGAAAGQVRLITSMAADGARTSIGITFHKWQNVNPAAGDRVLVKPLYSKHLILDNYIDSVPDPSSVEIDFGRIGILIWCTSHEMIIRRNTIKHCCEAIRIQCESGGPWVQIANHVRGNTLIDCLAGGPFDTYPKFYADIGGGPFVAGDQFHSVGNVFRDNVCAGSECGVMIGVADHDRPQAPRVDADYVASSRVGVMHSIIENNVITTVYGNIDRLKLMFAISYAANWTLIRNNRVDDEPSFNFYGRDKILDLLYVVRDRPMGLDVRT